MTDEQRAELLSLPGLVATVCTTGFVLPEYASAMAGLRSFNDRNGIHKVEYLTFNAQFVEAGRDAAVEHMLRNNYQWMLQIDADAAPFPENALFRLLHTAFISATQFDAIGAYAQLKGDIPIPTIDTGTGTWEEHYPDSGLLPVMRTGGHFLFTRRSAFERIGPGPWFRSSTQLSPLRAMATLDTFARTRLDGKNPFVHSKDWEGLLASAREVGHDEHSVVGEDSGFCDRLTAAGGQIAVDTSIVAGHVDKRYITPEDLGAAMEKRRRTLTQHFGVLAE